MVKKIVLGFVLVFFLMQVVTAVKNTDITIKTVPNAEVQLTVLAAEDGSSEVLERYLENADQYGDLSLTFSSSHSYFDVIVFIMYEGRKLMNSEKRVDNHAGEPLYIEMVPEGYPLVETPGETLVLEGINDTNSSEVVLDESPIEEEEVSIEEEVSTSIKTKNNPQESVQGFTGFVISDEFAKSKTLYAIIGIAFLGLLAIIFVKFKGKIMGVGSSVGGRKDSSNTISELQNEIKRLKSGGTTKTSKQKAIEKAKRRIIRDEKRLMNLRGSKE
jgi:tetrahydromethanopterin S-methyltransferase subunit B